MVVKYYKKGRFFFIKLVFKYVKGYKFECSHLNIKFSTINDSIDFCNLKRNFEVKG